MKPERLIEDEIAHVDLAVAPVEGCLPPQRLALVVRGLRRRAQHQRPLAVRHQNGDVFGLPDAVPLDQIIRRHLIDELRELLAIDPLVPASFPLADHPADGNRIASRIAPVGVNDRPPQDRNRGQLAGLADALHHLQFDLAGGLDRDLTEIPPDRVPNSLAFFEVGNDEGEAKGQQADQHHGGDDPALETLAAGELFQSGNTKVSRNYSFSLEYPELSSPGNTFTGGGAAYRGFLSRG